MAEESDELSPPSEKESGVVLIIDMRSVRFDVGAQGIEEVRL